MTVDGTTATVNLTGAAASASPADREQMATQLVWTLTGQPGEPAGHPGRPARVQRQAVDAVQPAVPEAGGQSPALKQAMYDCKNPYPAATSSAFYYVANGQAWSRCASEAQVTTGSVGVVVPVFDRTGAATLNQSCKSSVQASSQAVPPSQAHAPPPLSMVAVSPDGKYLAGVAPGGKTVTVWAAGAAKPSSTLSLPGVTAISWDRRDYLWVAQGDTTTMVVQTNDSSNHAEIPNVFPAGKILGLSIAPDGVRVAAIVQADSGPAVELAAIDSGKPGPGQPANPFNRTSIGPTVQLGPNVTNPIALTWYDADDLLVLDGAGDQTSLWEVPVDGQPGHEAARRAARRDLHHRQQRQERPGGRDDAEPDGGLGGPRGTLAAARQRRPEPGVPDPRLPGRSAVLAAARHASSTLCSRYMTICY